MKLDILKWVEKGCFLIFLEGLCMCMIVGLVWRGCFFVYVYVIYIFVLVFKEFGNFVGIRICI